MSTSIPVYGLDWHRKQSPAQNELMIDPLLPYIRFKRFDWDGVKLDLSEERIKKSPIVFFFFPPPENLMADINARLIWIPMWDETLGRGLEWWHNLPKNLRVVAFSDHVRKKAQSAGLTTLPLKFFKDPANLEPVDFEYSKVLFYWNRIGMVGPEFLRRFCEVLQIDQLLFRKQIDPRIPAQLEYSLPKRMGKTIVKDVPGIELLSHREYLKLLNQANIVIAPRLSEGVGLTFIEALTRGCAVFAYNAPTMNEYIHHKHNGYLISDYNCTPNNFIRQQKSKLGQWLRRRKIYPGKTQEPVYPVKPWQNWRDIGLLDLRMLGASARRSQADGFSSWQNSIPQYASFILDW